MCGAGWVVGAMDSGSVARPMIETGQIWLVWEPVDMRAGIDRLSGWIQESLGRSPCDGTAYVFRNRSGNRMKVLPKPDWDKWACRLPDAYGVEASISEEPETGHCSMMGNSFFRKPQEHPGVFQDRCRLNHLKRQRSWPFLFQIPPLQQPKIPPEHSCRCQHV